MKLSDYAKLNGVCYKTAYNWFNQGLIPNASKMPNGTILVNTDIKSTVERVVVYVRVNNHFRRKEMEEQVDRISTYCNSKGYPIEKVYREVASGMNDNRKELWRMIDSKPSIIVIENKDRITRFGFNYLDKLLLKQGCKIEVMNKDTEDEKDLIKDLVAVITSFCCRLYGMRRGYKKITKIKEEILDGNI